MNNLRALKTRPRRGPNHFSDAVRLSADLTAASFRGSLVGMSVEMRWQCCRRRRRRRGDVKRRGH